MAEACQVLVAGPDGDVAACGEAAEAVDMADGGVIWACAEHRPWVPEQGEEA